jgi:hypothetical protein
MFGHLVKHITNDDDDTPLSLVMIVSAFFFVGWTTFYWMYLDLNSHTNNITNTTEGTTTL